MRRFTKLHMWSWADDYDLLLYLDADVLCLGRLELTLDFFAPNGTSSHFLAAAPGGLSADHINAGVMAVQPNHAFFKEMMDALQTVHYKQKWAAEQAFLHAFLTEKYGWMWLPQIVNMLPHANIDRLRDIWKRDWPRALAVHMLMSPKVCRQHHRYLAFYAAANTVPILRTAVCNVQGCNADVVMRRVMVHGR